MAAGAGAGVAVDASGRRADFTIDRLTSLHGGGAASGAGAPTASSAALLSATHTTASGSGASAFRSLPPRSAAVGSASAASSGADRVKDASAGRLKAESQSGVAVTSASTTAHTNNTKPDLAHDYVRICPCLAF